MLILCNSQQKWNLFFTVTSRKYAYHLQCSRLWHLSFLTSFLKSSGTEQIQPLQDTPNLKRRSILNFYSGKHSSYLSKIFQTLQTCVGQPYLKSKVSLKCHPKFLMINCMWQYFGFKTKYIYI